MKKVKTVISHALLEKSDVKSATANANNMQHCSGQGSPAELFFKHSTRLFGLAILPKHQTDFSAESAKRSNARESQLKKTEALREPTRFATDEKVAIKNTDTG